MDIYFMLQFTCYCRSADRSESLLVSIVVIIHCSTFVRWRRKSCSSILVLSSSEIFSLMSTLQQLRNWQLQG